MIESVLFPGAVGFFWGLAVSVFNNFWSQKALKNPASFFGKLVFMFRLGIMALAMIPVYKNTPMLIGTALGLLAVKNYIFVKNLYIIFRERKG